MPAWFFSKKPKPKPPSPNPLEPYDHHVSTLSSVGEIVSSVSAANLAENQRKDSGDEKRPPKLAPKLTVRQCCCCGTRLQVPESVASYKCSICDTTHDLKPEQAVPKKYAVPLTISLVNKAVETDTRQQPGTSAAAVPGAGDAAGPDHPVFELADDLDGSNAAFNSNGSGTSGEDGELVHPQRRYRHLEKLLAGACSSVATLNQSFTLGSDKLSYSRPNIDYDQVREFYATIQDLPSTRPAEILVRTLIKLLKRPGHAIDSCADIGFLLIILENPIFYSHSFFSSRQESAKFSHLVPLARELLERTVGILSHVPKRAKHYLLNWLSRFPLDRFSPKVELLNAYVAHRLTIHYQSGSGGSRHKGHYRSKNNGHSRSRSEAPRDTNNSSDSGTGRQSVLSTSAPTSTSTAARGSKDHHQSASVSPMFFTATNLPRTKKRRANPGQIKPALYGDDWRIAAFVRVLAIFFNASTVSHNKVPISAFYNSMVDFVDASSDFDDWQRLGVPTSSLSLNNSVTALSSHRQRQSTVHGTSALRGVVTSAGQFTHGISDFPSLYEQKVAFCQYPFLLSMGSKTHILEYDARRQMETKAQEAFFGALERRCSVSPFLYIRVDRNHILQDSFEAFEKNEDDLKKSLRIEFMGEPGVDAGGLRKEWFMLLIKELVNPDIGLFVEEEESRYSWFNISTAKRPLKYYKLAGVAVGLALYNSTILDINFAPALYKKLLGTQYTLEDFTAFKPAYGRSLQQLLDYEKDDFEEVFGLNFCLYTRDGESIVEELLVNDGDKIAVTKANRHDYVRRVIGYYLDTSVRRQYETFKQGFYNVVGGNALTLFRPEEIELLIRGSPEAVDVDALQSVTKYQHWGPKGHDASEELVVKWFWKYFRGLQPEDQRKLLVFVTGSDRIPATGIANMMFRISKLGEDSERFPVSHTCFNQLCLYSYSSPQKLEHKLTMAINESQGFGMK